MHTLNSRTPTDVRIVNGSGSTWTFPSSRPAAATTLAPAQTPTIIAPFAAWSFNQRSTETDAVASAHCEHLIEGDFGTNVSRYLFYFKFFSSDNFVLFATGFYDRVHVKPHQIFMNGIFFLATAPKYPDRIRKTADYT